MLVLNNFLYKEYTRDVISVAALFLYPAGEIGARVANPSSSFALFCKRKEKVNLEVRRGFWV